MKLELSKDCPLVDKVRYQRLVRKQIYLSHTRLDIAFSVNLVSRFMNNPNEEQWGALHEDSKIPKTDSGSRYLF